MPKKRKPFSSMTALEIEKESKRRAFEEGELVDALGQRSDLKARADVRRYFNELEAEEKAVRDEAYEILWGLKQRTKKEYNDFLIAVFSRFISQEHLPKKYSIYATSNDVGLIVGIKGSGFYKAIKSCGMPLYDYLACKTLAIQVGNTIAKLEGFVRETKAGVLIPDSHDVKQFTKNG
jgi:hypothetical protein